MTLSQRLIDHEKEGEALEWAVKPYMRLLTWFKYEGGNKTRQFPSELTPDTPMPKNLYFDRFNVYNQWVVVFHFNQYGGYGADWKDEYTVPIEWLNLPHQEFFGKLAWQQFKEIESQCIAISAVKKREKAEELEKQKKE